MNASALLDHPWPLDEVLDGHSQGFNVLRRFFILQARHQLAVVPFLNADELEEIRNRLFARKPKDAGFAAVMRSLSHIVRKGPVGCEATPDPEPPSLTPAWKTALRESIEATGTWRHPQIIVAESRQADWPPQFVNVILENCAEKRQIRQAAGERIIATLGSYEAHPFATSDFDPWLLDRIHPPGQNGPQHPCRLPKPTALNAYTFDDFETRLPSARQAGWLVQGRYFYLPPATWKAANVNQNSWRQGRTFPLAQTERRGRKRGQTGFLDFEGRIWVWDDQHRHWDVQLGGKNYRRVRPDGQLEEEG